MSSSISASGTTKRRTGADLVDGVHAGVDGFKRRGVLVLEGVPWDGLELAGVDEGVEYSRLLDDVAGGGSEVTGGVGSEVTGGVGEAGGSDVSGRGG